MDYLGGLREMKRRRKKAEIKVRERFEDVIKLEEGAKGQEILAASRRDAALPTP